MMMESLWHRARAWRNRGKPDADSRAKAEESRALLALMQQAWTETAGGGVSPPRPW